MGQPGATLPLWAEVPSSLPAAADAAAPGQLRAWAPESWPVAADWQSVLQPFWASATGQKLARFVQARLQAGAEIYPAQPLRALELTPLSEVSVVILGQDPYHGPDRKSVV